MLQDAGGETYLLAGPLETGLLDGAEHLARLQDRSGTRAALGTAVTHDGTHVRLLHGELGQDVRDEELLHAVLYVWVPHDEVAQSRGHIQGTETLGRRWFPAVQLGMASHLGDIYVRVENTVDEGQHGHKGDFCAVAGK